MNLFKNVTPCHCEPKAWQSHCLSTEIATSLTLLAMTGRGTGLVPSIRARNPAPRNDENVRIKQGVESCS